MSDNASNIIGWDIGGAHLKVVLLDAKGEVIDCLQLPCPLWKGLDYLQRAIIDALAQLNVNDTLQAFKIKPSSVCHAITMTGELVDLFENRQQGVCEIAKVASDLLGEQVWFYAANSDIDHGFVRQHDVHRFSSQIASTNWHASASALATHVQDALLVDIGSTTTDIIAIEGGKVVSAGLSDAYRMQADSLVYTGVVRTPVMALAQKLPFDDKETNVAAEYFASMADVYRLTGELDVNADLAETADGKGKTALESARRLARMIGHDVGNSLDYQQMEKWIHLAFVCKSLQMRQIKQAMLKQLKPNMTIIGAGAGSFLLKQIAADLNVEYMHAYKPISMRFSEHANLTLKQDIQICFPAFSVAYLLASASLC